MQDKDREWGWENCPDIERHPPQGEAQTPPEAATPDTVPETGDPPVSEPPQSQTPPAPDHPERGVTREVPFRRLQASPVYVPESGGGRQGVKWFPLKLTLAIIACVILIVGLISAWYIGALYDVYVTPSTDGLTIRMADKYASGGSGIYGGDAYADVLPGEQDDALAAPAWDGTTLEISSSEGFSTSSLPEIYQKCISSIVLVTVVTYEGEVLATGVIMSENGYIVTNAHVVEGATAIAVELADGAYYEAALVGQDTPTDLAVLKIDAAGLTPAEFGDSDDLQVGDEVAAIGNPLGQTFSMSNGIVSAVNRDISLNGYDVSLIQTNVAINEGNSGGALINIFGQVVGITNMKLYSLYSYASVEGMAFAIPTSVVQPIVNELLENGIVIGRPSIGITCAGLDAVTAKAYDLPQGIYVEEAYPQSDAYGKLFAGDVIVEANGTPVTTNAELSEIKDALSVGDVISLTVYRDGETITVDITLVDANELD